MNNDLAAYYQQRAGEYDKVYHIPQEQNDLKKASEMFQELFAQKQVLEIACGTGYWTEQISKTANSVLATDINQSVIDIAQSRAKFSNVSFQVADMYDFAPAKSFNALFGGFIWSHVLLQQLDTFLARLNSFLEPGAVVAFIDSKAKESGAHSAKSITHTDTEGNTYQTRQLENGTSHRVLKNFPTQEFLRQKLSAYSGSVSYIDLEHYWLVIYQLDKPRV